MNVLDLDVTAMARALRNGEISAREIAGAIIDNHARSGEINHAYQSWAPELAMACAHTADQAFQAGSVIGPLQGIPVSVKDLFGVDGLPTFAGTAYRLPEKWQLEGPVIRALRRNLAIITGKTHTVEMAFGGLGINNHWGTPRNPWDTTRHRVPGGSSSGAGVSLVEGTAKIALGTDTAGSVRIPASMTGNVGLKTSYGRWSRDGIVPLSPTLDSVGLLGRTVSDVAYAFAALDERWPTVESFLMSMDEYQYRRIVIGIADPLFQHCDDSIADAVDSAIRDIEGPGLEVRRVEFPEHDDAVELLKQGNVVAAECDEFLASELPGWRDSLDDLVAARLKDGCDIDAREYLARKRRLKTLAIAAAARFRGLDVIAGPTVAISPPPVDEVKTLEQYRSANMRALGNTCSANSLGLCALTLPVGLDDNGMPVGLQLLAPSGEDEKLLAVARQLEIRIGTGPERLGMPLENRT